MWLADKKEWGVILFYVVSGIFSTFLAAQMHPCVSCR